MNLRPFAATMLCFAGALLASSAIADFEPLFRVTEITGECTVKRPDDTAFEAVVPEKAYPYGTQVRTGARSTAVIVLSEGNTCRILANALLTMDEDVTDPKLKRVMLEDGEVHVKLQEDFHKNGNKLNVETAQAICGAIGCDFRVASQVEDQLRVILIRVIDGEIRVTGLFYSIGSLKAGQHLSLVTPPDNAFLRIKNLKGEYAVNLRQGDTGEKTITTKEGFVMKVWMKEIPETGDIVVSVSITDPDGKLVETVNATFTKEEMEEKKGESGRGKGRRGQRPRFDGRNPFRTTTTSTTTTTVKPTPSPVGNS